MKCLPFFSENRYLLILTENYAALPIMQQHLLKTADDAVVIFGSSFPNDQEYTQVKCITGFLRTFGDIK